MFECLREEEDGGRDKTAAKVGDGFVAAKAVAGTSGAPTLVDVDVGGVGVGVGASAVVVVVVVVNVVVFSKTMVLLDVLGGDGGGDHDGNGPVNNPPYDLRISFLDTTRALAFSTRALASFWIF